MKITATINEEAQEIRLDDDDWVTMTMAGNIVELQYLEHKNIKANVRKLDADRYVNLTTGEILFVKHGETRVDNKAGLYKTFKRLRYLINANFAGRPNELFFTLTYADNMQDAKQLAKDFDTFSKRLKRRYAGFEYLTVVEPQERGAWHCHVLMRWPEREKIYIANSELAELWGHGFVKTMRTKGVDNLGAYLTAYLTDIPVDDNSASGGSVVEKTVDGKTKKFIKGGRLHLYPANMKYYRHSRGIKEPVRFDTTYSQAKQKADLAEPTFTRNIFVSKGDFSNAIRYEQFNTSRK